MLICAISVFGDLCNDASVDEGGVGIVVFGVGGVPLSVFKAFLIGLQFFREPADAIAVTEIIVRRRGLKGSCSSRITCGKHNRG